MRYARIVVGRYGGRDELLVIEGECPEPKPGEVRVRILAAGVSLPDLMMREGIHPEKPRVPFTPGWDLVGVVDRIGDAVVGIEPGQMVAALPIHGAYSEFIHLPVRDLVPVPSGLDPAEAVSLVLNYTTAYQMMHRSAKAEPGRRALIHAAAGGVGSALLQLGRLAGLEMYGTCSPARAAAVSEMGGLPGSSAPRFAENDGMSKTKRKRHPRAVSGSPISSSPNPQSSTASPRRIPNARMIMPSGVHRVVLLRAPTRVQQDRRNPVSRLLGASPVRLLHNQPPSGSCPTACVRGVRRRASQSRPRDRYPPCERCEKAWCATRKLADGGTGQGAAVGVRPNEPTRNTRLRHGGGSARV